MRQFLCGACDHFTAVCPSCECPILAGDYAEVGAGLFRGYPTLRASHQSEPALRIVGKTIRLTEEKSTPIITSAIGKWFRSRLCGNGQSDDRIRGPSTPSWYGSGSGTQTTQS